MSIILIYTGAVFLLYGVYIYHSYINAKPVCSIDILILLTLLFIFTVEIFEL